MAYKLTFTRAFTLHRGDEVAILPRHGASPEQVRYFAIVAFAGVALIELNNGRVYYAKDGQGVYDCSRIVPATDEHRAALHRSHEAEFGQGQCDRLLASVTAEKTRSGEGTDSQFFADCD